MVLLKRCFLIGKKLLGYLDPKSNFDFGLFHCTLLEQGDFNGIHGLRHLARR